MGQNGKSGVANQPQQPQNKKLPKRGEKRKEAKGMNLAIAGLHEFTVQLLGLIMAIANLLALILSACTAVAGLVMTTIQQFPGQYFLWGVVGAIAAVVSLLAERGTIDRLTTVRMMNREIKTAKKKMEEGVEGIIKTIPLPSPLDSEYTQKMKQYTATIRTVESDAKKRYNKTTKEQKKTRRAALFLGLFFAVASGTGGALLWHNVFGGLGIYGDLGASFILSLLVTGTFVSTELNRDQHEAGIREGFTGGRLAMRAIEEETHHQLTKQASQKVLRALETPEAEDLVNKHSLLLLEGVLGDISEEVGEKVRKRRSKESDGNTSQEMFVEGQILSETLGTLNQIMENLPALISEKITQTLNERTLPAISGPPETPPDGPSNGPGGGKPKEETYEEPELDPQVVVEEVVEMMGSSSATNAVLPETGPLPRMVRRADAPRLDLASLKRKEPEPVPVAENVRPLYSGIVPVPTRLKPGRKPKNAQQPDIIREA